MRVRLHPSHSSRGKGVRASWHVAATTRGPQRTSRRRPQERTAPDSALSGAAGPPAQNLCPKSQPCQDKGPETDLACFSNIYGWHKTTALKETSQQQQKSDRRTLIPHPPAALLLRMPQVWGALWTRSKEPGSTRGRSSPSHQEKERVLARTQAGSTQVGGVWFSKEEF